MPEDDVDRTIREELKKEAEEKTKDLDLKKNKEELDRKIGKKD